MWALSLLKQEIQSLCALHVCECVCLSVYPSIHLCTHSFIYPSLPPHLSPSITFQSTWELGVRRVTLGEAVRSYQHPHSRHSTPAPSRMPPLFDEPPSHPPWEVCICDRPCSCSLLLHDTHTPVAVLPSLHHPPDAEKVNNFLKLFSRSVVSDSLRPHESQHTRPPCPSPTPGVHPNSCASRWCHPAISSSVVPFSSCPQFLPASGSFPMSQPFSWGGQSIGVSASASVLPMNTQNWSFLGWTGWISLQSKGLSRVFSKTTVQKHQLFWAQLSL